MRAAKSDANAGGFKVVCKATRRGARKFRWASATARERLLAIRLVGDARGCGYSPRFTETLKSPKQQPFSNLVALGWWLHKHGKLEQNLPLDTK